MADGAVGVLRSFGAQLRRAVGGAESREAIGDLNRRSDTVHGSL